MRKNFGKKTLFKNVLYAFFISFCSYGSFLWLKTFQVFIKKIDVK